MKDYQYYKEQLNRVGSDFPEYQMTVKFQNPFRSSNHLDVNKESIDEMISFLTRMRTKLENR